MKKLPAVEWSYPVDVNNISDTGSHYRIKANEAERAALAIRFGVLSIEELSAALELKCERGGLVIHVTGNLHTDLTQECVVTCDLVQNHIEDKFEAFYSDTTKALSFAKAKAEHKARHGEPEIEMMDERDAPEPIENGVLDMGELVAQFLSLAIDPYPRKQGLPEPDQNIDSKEENKIDSPFAALKGWKDGL